MVNRMKRYYPQISEEEINKVDKLVEFLQQHNLFYYNIEGPLIRQRHEGNVIYMDVLVSIKVSEKP